MVTWPRGRNIPGTGRSFENLPCHPVSCTGCQTAIRGRGKLKGVGAWPAELSWRVPSRKLGHLNCLFSSSRLVLVRLGTEGSAGPGLLTVPGQAPRYAVGRKAALVFVFLLNLVLVVCATYPAAAPQGAFMRMGGSQYIYWHGGTATVIIALFLRVRYHFGFVFAVPGYIC
jgi:hypothetical protein